ncbi:MAG: putative sporulation protein YtxC, partial [Peptococcaceae bacterium]|jgi:putative sporulation protein YtxC|nr:putative sporulation protein YtxC [Peptococcaceae bacterium]
LHCEAPEEVSAQQRKDRLAALIMKCLEQSQNFHIEGFLRFRAREYREELDRLIQGAMEAYLLEKEYLEFVQLLQRFVGAQIAKFDSVHIRILGDGQAQLLNDQGRGIAYPAIEKAQVKAQAQTQPRSIAYEDLMISALISIAPRRITLHLQRLEDAQSYTLQVIRQVFDDRIHVCLGCAMCRPDTLL